MKGAHTTGEPIYELAARMLRTLADVGFARDFARARWSNLPALAPVVVREGVNIRTIHHVNACLYPNRTAVVDNRRRLTFEKLDDEINRIARAMQLRFGVEAGTPVVVAMQNRVEYLVLWMALSRLGAATVHASWRQTAEELAYQIEDSGATLVFAGQSAGEAVALLDQSDDGDRLRIVGVDDDVGRWSYRTLVESSTPRFPTRRDSRFELGSDNIVYTSGTTGRPKGAVRDMSAYGLVEFFRVLERLPVRAGDRHLVVSPMYHSGGQVFSLMNTALGATLYLLPEFDPKTTLRTLHEEAIHTVFLVPAMLRRILELPQDKQHKWSTPALRGIFCGAAPFSQPLRERAIEQFGASVIHDFYGATEIGWITLINGEEMLEKPGSAGRPIAGQQVRIVDEQGHDLKSHETGTIYVRNQHIMEGYLGNREATEEIIDDDGWMTVEDLGYLDDDGYLYLAGRARDMVISGGVNIYPAEIEEVLQGHGDVDDVAVVGVEDDQWGESLVAVVVGDADVQELEDYARGHLSGYKVPRRWHFVDELPRNPTGKVLKRNLEARFGNEEKEGVERTGSNAQESEYERR